MVGVGGCLVLGIARLGVVGLFGLAPLAFVGCESGLGVPLDATGRVARGLGLPQGFRSVLACSGWED